MLGTILNLDMHERVFKSGKEQSGRGSRDKFPCPTHGLLRITSPSRAPPTADASAGGHPLVAAVLFFLGECIKTGTPRLAHTAQPAGSAGQSPPSRFITRSGTVQRPNGLFRYRPSRCAPWLRSACGALWLRPAHRGAANPPSPPRACGAGSGSAVFCAADTRAVCAAQLAAIPIAAILQRPAALPASRVRAPVRLNASWGTTRVLPRSMQC